MDENNNNNNKIIIILLIVLIILVISIGGWLIFGKNSENKSVIDKNTDVNNEQNINYEEEYNSEEIMSYLALAEAIDYKINGNITEELAASSLYWYLTLNNTKDNENNEYLVNKNIVDDIISKAYGHTYNDVYKNKILLTEQGNEYKYTVLPKGLPSHNATLKSKNVDGDKKTIEYNISCTWMKNDGTANSNDIPTNIAVVTINLTYNKNSKSYLAKSINYKTLIDENSGACYE